MAKQTTRYVGKAKTLLFVVALLGVLVFALAACGGSDSSGSNGGSSSATTLTIKETKGASGGADTYTVDPATVSLNKGDKITVKNASDENFDFDAGDAPAAGVDFKVGLNQSIDVTFNKTGTFNIKSEKNNGTFTVTVK